MPIPRCARLLLAGFFPLCLASAANGAVLTDEPVVPSASEVVIELARHQLTPEVLCIAGFVPAEIDGFIGHATDTLVDEWDEMLAANANASRDDAWANSGNSAYPSVPFQITVRAPLISSTSASID